ncbi:hypothetical protein AKO1_012094 [Acrasis kona]|uniref:C2 domain-containing protein n=1 Tax=Acrasis kona TaxID=1008807 RepID=A0AAW2ZD36_9EUKA
MDRVFDIPQLEIYIHGRDLHRDVVKQPKVSVTLFMAMSAPKVNVDTKWSSLGQSEVIRSTCPHFTKTWVVEYDVVADTHLRVELNEDKLMDGVVKKTKPNKVAFAQFTLSELSASSNGKLSLQLRYASPLTNTDDYRNENGKNLGFVDIIGELLSDPNVTKEKLTMEYSASHLKKMDILSNTDGFFYLLKKIGDEWVEVYKSEVIDNNLNPTWQKFKISSTKLCSGNYNNAIKFKCYDWNKVDACKKIGEFELPLHMHRDQPLKNDKNIHSGGRISLVLTREPITTIHDYFDKRQLKIIVGIDFTVSNGALHNLSETLNPCTLLQCIETFFNSTLDQRVLEELSRLLSPYNYDEKITGYGFGCKPTKESENSQLFALNFNDAKPQCNGFGELFDAYQNTLKRVVLYGPGMLAPIINKANKLTAVDEHCLLFILTDGIPMDHALLPPVHDNVTCAIIGIGNDDFSSMSNIIVERDWKENTTREALRRLNSRLCKWFSELKHQ